MRLITVTETKTFKVFDPGEQIIPTSILAALPPPGPYEVLYCYIPTRIDDDAVVFVKGHEFGMSTEYWDIVDGSSSTTA